MNCKLRYSRSSLGDSTPGTPGRQGIAKCYRSHLAELPVELLEVAPGARSSNHLFVVQSDRRDYLRQRLQAEGIGTDIHYPIPCHRQPALSSIKNSPPSSGRACGTAHFVTADGSPPRRSLTQFVLLRQSVVPSRPARSAENLRGAELAP